MALGLRTMIIPDAAADTLYKYTSTPAAPGAPPRREWSVHIQVGGGGWGGWQICACVWGGGLRAESSHCKTHFQFEILVHSHTHISSRTAASALPFFVVPALVPWDAPPHSTTSHCHTTPHRAQAGAGIVADSKPEAEYEETVNKAAALGRAVDLAEQAFVADGRTSA